MRRLILIVAALVLAACNSAQQSIERAGEKTGQTLDRAAKATGQAVDRAGRATGNALERAGETIERKVGN
jgi:starvation-inducible outer membrane lipoprotein